MVDIDPHLLDTVVAEKAVELQQIGVVANHGDIKARMVDAALCGYLFYQLSCALRNYAMDHLAPLGNIVMKAFTHSPVATGNLVANPYNAHISVDRQ